jgi:hypothetical protein
MAVFSFHVVDSECYRQNEDKGVVRDPNRRPACCVERRKNNGRVKGLVSLSTNYTPS